MKTSICPHCRKEVKVKYNRWLSRHKLDTGRMCPYSNHQLQGVNWWAKTLPIIALTLSLLVPGCVPLVLGGAAGYAVYEHEKADQEHAEWMAREEAKLDKMRQESGY